MYRYETHLHTRPVSKCARATVRDTVLFYQSIGYDGIFITNHFLDGNIALPEENMSYEEKIRFYCSDFEEGERIGNEIGLKVFFGVEISYGGTDFLIYGLGKDWLIAHPEIMELKKSAELALLRDAGAMIIQAHPFREAGYIDHLRLFPRHVEGVETVNACRTPFENQMAEDYAKAYGLKPFAGSDNHLAGACGSLAGIETETPIGCVENMITAFRSDAYRVFHIPNPTQS